MSARLRPRHDCAEGRSISHQPRRRLVPYLFPLPFPLANFSAKVLQLLPNPLLTQDQLRLLKYDNIVSGKYKTNFDIGIPSRKIFENEVKKYCYMWKDGGQFSKEEYSLKNFENKKNS